RRQWKSSSPTACASAATWCTAGTDAAVAPAHGAAIGPDSTVGAPPARAPLCAARVGRWYGARHGAALGIETRRAGICGERAPVDRARVAPQPGAPVARRAASANGGRSGRAARTRARRTAAAAPRARARARARRVTHQRAQPAVALGFLLAR